MSKPHLTVGVIGAMNHKTHINLTSALFAQKMEKFVEKMENSKALVHLDVYARQYEPPPPPPPVYTPNMKFYKVCKLSKNWANYLSKDVGYYRTPFLFAYAAAMLPKPTQAEMLNIVAKFRNAIKNRSRVTRLSRRWNYWDREATKYLRKYGAIARRTNRKLPVDYNDLDLEYFNSL